MKLLITGRPGSGKTTVIKKVIEGLGKRALGFYTQEIREKERRRGFEIITTWGERGILAHTSINSGLKVSRYGVSLEFLEKVVDELRKRWLPGEVMIVDEIGKMELFSELFREWIREAALDPNMPFLATIALKSRDPVVIHLKKALPCWEVTHLNRNKLAAKVLEYLQSP